MKTQLVNDCSIDVPCSKEKYQQNRRSEFIIITSSRFREGFFVGINRIKFGNIPIFCIFGNGQ